MINCLRKFPPKSALNWFLGPQRAWDHELLVTQLTRKSIWLPCITTHWERNFTVALLGRGEWKINKKSEPEWPVIWLISPNSVKQPLLCMFMYHPASPSHFNYPISQGNENDSDRWAFVLITICPLKQTNYEGMFSHNLYTQVYTDFRLIVL